MDVVPVGDSKRVDAAVCLEVDDDVGTLFLVSMKRKTAFCIGAFKK